MSPTTHRNIANATGTKCMGGMPASDTSLAQHTPVLVVHLDLWQLLHIRWLYGSRYVAMLETLVLIGPAPERLILVSLVGVAKRMPRLVDLLVLLVKPTWPGGELFSMIDGYEMVLVECGEDGQYPASYHISWVAWSDCYHQPASVEFYCNIVDWAGGLWVYISGWQGLWWRLGWQQTFRCCGWCSRS